MDELARSRPILEVIQRISGQDHRHLSLALQPGRPGACLTNDRGPAVGTDSLSCNYGAEAGADVFLNAVHAAAENTSTLATMTGDALISTP